MKYGAMGQSSPQAATLTDLYMVPVGKHATVRVVACNRGASTTIRVALAPVMATDAAAQYLIYDLTLEANASQGTAPVTCGETDVLRVWSGSGEVSFTATGIESE